METETDKTETVEPQSPWPGEDSGSDHTGTAAVAAVWWLGRRASGGGSGDGGAARTVLGTLCTAGCRGASGHSNGGGTSRFTVSGTALARVLARAFGGVDSGGARPISENSAAPHHGHIVAPPLQENPAALLCALRRPAAAPQRRLAARSRGCAGCSRQVGDGRHDSPEVAGH